MDVQPAQDVKDVQKDAEDRVKSLEEDREHHEMDEYCCQGGFDHFGKWYSKKHDPCCREGEPIDDFYDRNCMVEILHTSRWQRARIERRHDLVRCFESPSQAGTVLPLTGGRVMESCIRDQE